MSTAEERRDWCSADNHADQPIVCGGCHEEVGPEVFRPQGQPKPVPTPLIDELLERVHDWLMADGHDYAGCARMAEADAEYRCGVCEDRHEYDSDSMLTGARQLIELMADELTPYSFIHNPDEEE